MFSTAGPERTGCEQQHTHPSRRLQQGRSGLTSVPAVSIKSSMISRCARDVTDDVHDFGDILSMRRLSTMASAASTFLAKKRARSTPPASAKPRQVRQIQPFEMSTSTGEAIMVHRNVENPCN